MTLGIMQPYFFPYLPYFSLIKHCNLWISLDNVQYIQRGWVNRNRILHPSKPESTYIIIPLKKHHQKTNINEILIDDTKPYASRIMGQLTASYKKHAPYFSSVMALVESCLSSESVMLSKLNEISIKRVCEHLGIDTKISIMSQMNLDNAPVHEASNSVQKIAGVLKADTYLNAIGGTELYDSREFELANIDLKFLKQDFDPYDQRKSVFLEGLSIIDVMMYNDPNQIRNMLDHCQLVSAGEA